ncbi:PKD domain-containing protein [bacterium A37T11]|nr:PKD domain-containing protein [bacterium A37T11]
MKITIMSTKAFKIKLKRNRLKYIIILGMILFFNSCKDKKEVSNVEELPNPTANFTSAEVSEKDPFTYKFISQSENYKNIFWDFGDDSVAYDETPLHTFSTTGEYRIKLVVKNELKDWAQNEEIIKIEADSILDIQAQKHSGTLMRLSPKTSMDIDSAFWYRDSSSNPVLIDIASSIDVSAPTGSLENYTLKVKTKKKSVVQINRLLSERGIVYDVTNSGVFSVSAENSSGKDASEGSLKLIDNLKTTKFLLFNFAGNLWIEFKYYNPTIISAYSLTTGNDAPSRDPKDWYMAGSNDGIDWKVLDQHSEEHFSERRMSVTYLFNNKTPYRYYRLFITEINSGTLFQMSELRMLQFPSE